MFFVIFVVRLVSFLFSQYAIFKFFHASVSCLCVYVCVVLIVHVIYTHAKPTRFSGRNYISPVYQKTCENYQILMIIVQTKVFLIPPT